MGAQLREGFLRLQSRFPSLIGSVRGVGLMQGLEILRPGFNPSDPMSRREPWPEGASAVVYAMRARRILLSCDGMSSNVIKLKPPMVFAAADAARVLRELEEVMHGLDTRTLLASSLPPTFVHVAQPLPASSGSVARISAGSSVGAPSGDVVVMRTPLPSFSPSVLRAGDKRRRDNESEGSGTLGEIVSLLGAIRGDVAALSSRVARVESSIGKH